MNKFLKLIFVGVFILPVVAHATVTQLVFTTEPITVAPGAISEGLTVSSGEAVGEISDLALVSSSATGEFLNSSGQYLDQLGIVTGLTEPFIIVIQRPVIILLRQL